MAICFSPQPTRASRTRGAGVTAVLGPTNTGKTHLAIERMLAHSSGMIGLPLRLLAREVYNKVVDRAGADSVALITGEEKIKPANPRFWVSTVEAMPRDLDVAFLAIDEVQLGADLERGHVFTDRMLNARAREETLVLGAATMRPMVEKLLPGAHIVSRPRLSMLTYRRREEDHPAAAALGHRRLLGRGSLRHRRIDPPPARRRGGRAGRAVARARAMPRSRSISRAMSIIWSPPTRSAWGSISMSIMSPSPADRKFDGYQFRKLNPAELAQIAGRAGRATRDGTFGTTGPLRSVRAGTGAGAGEPQLRAGAHAAMAQRRSRFSSIGALQASLATTPTEQGLTRAPIGEDILVFEHAARDEDVRALAQKPRGDRAAVGCLPGSRLPQDRARHPCRTGGDPLWIPDARG